MAIYEITADQIRKIPETTYSLAGLRERYDLQRLFRSQFDVISPDTLIIAEEFGEWEASHRRIDLLGRACRLHRTLLSTRGNGGCSNCHSFCFSISLGLRRVNPTRTGYLRTPWSGPTAAMNSFGV